MFLEYFSKDIFLLTYLTTIGRLLATRGEDYKLSFYKVKSNNTKFIGIGDIYSVHNNLSIKVILVNRESRPQRSRINP